MATWSGRVLSAGCDGVRERSNGRVGGQGNKGIWGGSGGILIGSLYLITPHYLYFHMRNGQCLTLPISCHVDMFCFVLFCYCFCCSGADSEERKRPVIVHRAMLGSVERMMAILTESFGGKW